VSDPTAQRIMREVAELLAARFPQMVSWAVTTEAERGDDGCPRQHVTICFDLIDEPTQEDK
jgi:hypothetical protein